MTLINGSRREFLKTMAAAGAGLLPGCGLLAQSARQAGRNNSGRIDVHHHFQTPELTGGPARGWTPARSLEQMDKYGIATALLSHPGDGGLFDANEKARALARKVNEIGAKNRERQSETLRPAGRHALSRRRGKHTRDR